MVHRVRKAWPVAAQTLGGALALAGVHVLLGLGVTLLVAGLGLAAFGTAREAGWL